MHTLQRVNQAITLLDQDYLSNAVVIPINLGNVINDEYRGSHWVGLVIKRTVGNGLEAFYNDSFGTPMDISVPALRQILKNHEVNYITDFQHKQQFNGYDCGPWTVFNIDSMARAGKLPESIKDEDITNQRLSIQPIFQKIEITTNDHSSNTSTDKAESKEDKEVNELIEETKHLSLTSPPATELPLTNIPVTTFVINTIAYVPEREFDNDSSDEELDGTFPDELFNFDKQSKDSIPFTTTIPKYARKKANEIDIKPIIENQ